jgi:ribosomal protein L17
MMFRNFRKIKDLEHDVQELKLLCNQLTSSVISLMQQQAVITEALKKALEHQKIMDRLISNKYGIKTANDDDIIH